MRRSLLAFALLVAFGAAEATAQATVNTTLSFTMQERLFIDVTSGNLVFPDPTFADLDAGYTQTVSHDVLHRGNVDHTITVAPAGPWIQPLSYPGIKPVDDLEWSNDGGTNWNVVSAAVDVGAGVQGGFGLNPAITVDWQAAIGYDEPLGGYSMTVTYTSTAN